MSRETAVHCKSSIFNLFSYHHRHHQSPGLLSYFLIVQSSFARKLLPVSFLPELARRRCLALFIQPTKEGYKAITDELTWGWDPSTRESTSIPSFDNDELTNVFILAWYDSYDVMITIWWERCNDHNAMPARWCLRINALNAMVSMRLSQCDVIMQGSW